MLWKLVFAGLWKQSEFSTYTFLEAIEATRALTVWEENKMRAVEAEAARASHK